MSPKPIYINVIKFKKSQRSKIYLSAWVFSTHYLKH